MMGRISVSVLIALLVAPPCAAFRYPDLAASMPVMKFQNVLGGRQTASVTVSKVDQVARAAYEIRTCVIGVEC